MRVGRTFGTTKCSRRLTEIALSGHPSLYRCRYGNTVTNTGGCGGTPVVVTGTIIRRLTSDGCFTSTRTIGPKFVGLGLTPRIITRCLGRVTTSRGLNIRGRGGPGGIVVSCNKPGITGPLRIKRLHSTVVKRDVGHVVHFGKGSMAKSVRLKS